ncbi:MAG TPA: hypothetical protein VFT48_13315 [Pyrinomonadaceae bacterium]|nr:hypothetical protein [Pyrinomonadaceae bacterium]
MKKYLLLTALIAVATSSSLVTAQQQKPALQPSSTRKAPEAPTELLLEVNYNPAIPPAYSTVNGPEVKPKWIWVTKFIRIPDIKTAGPPIRAVKLESQFNGETADVRVTLLRGEKGFDQEDLVGIYHLGVGEERTIKDLRAHGVDPFRITLLNPAPPLPPPPTFENLTQTIDVASVRSENVPKPAYVVTFRNASDKSLLALRTDVKRDGKYVLASLYHAEDGKPIIEPGGTGERYIPVVTAQPNAMGSYEPGTAPANTVVIRSAVFADLSFEGEVQPACEIESIRMGRRVWLRHVLPLLEQELQRPVNDHIEAARQFKEKFAVLDYEFSESERSQASSVSPLCKKPIEMAEMMPKALKLKTLRDLDEIITKRPSPPVHFKNWLAVRHADYKAWVARL